MGLVKDYYSILSLHTAEDGSTVFRVALNPDCSVYKGHFPERPVSPGVCNVRMVTECAHSLLGEGKWILSEIRQCRFTELIAPQTHPELDVTVSLGGDPAGGTVRLTASILRDDRSCLSLKGTLTKSQQSV